MNTEPLIAQGVEILCPASVHIDPAVIPTRISHRGVRIHQGCHIAGPQTFIAEGAHIGTEGPATVVDCWVGPGVELKSGYFENAVFLEGAKLGPGSHVRGGTILEEQASTAHCVGLKQTILLPFVTLGSLINFCDCLMAGGTDRKNHSEVGSSFIHFNYTPNQDKATPSIMGDVPLGVMLNQRPIFLGGQGGLVGPCRIAYGTVSAAGTIVRKDQIKPGHLIFGGAGKEGRIPWKPGGIGSMHRIIRNNFYYIGNLFALRHWYDQVRRRFTGRRFPEELHAGLMQTLDQGLNERVLRLGFYIESLDKTKISQTWEKIQAAWMDRARGRGGKDLRDAFLNQMESVCAPDKSYLETIQSLPPATAAIGSQWLASIVDEIVASGLPMEN